MKRIYILLISLVSVFLYLLAWNLAVRYELMPHPPEATKSSEDSVEVIIMTEAADLVIFRYGFIPIYWSRLGGSLTLYHLAFFTILLCTTILLVVRKNR